MAIQFRCAGCKHPIEVDDLLADQSVACPYCEHVNTAPRLSTLRPEDTFAAPVARPLGEPGAQRSRGARARTLAIVAICSTVIGVGLLLFGSAQLAFLYEEFGPQPDMKELQERLEPYLRESGRTSEFYTGMTLFVAGSALGLLGLVLAIMAFIRRDESAGKLPNLALVLAILVPLMSCLIPTGVPVAANRPGVEGPSNEAPPDTSAPAAPSSTESPPGDAD